MAKDLVAAIARETGLGRCGEQRCTSDILIG